MSTRAIAEFYPTGRAGTPQGRNLQKRPSSANCPWHAGRPWEAGAGQGRSVTVAPHLPRLFCAGGEGSQRLPGRSGNARLKICDKRTDNPALWVVRPSFYTSSTMRVCRGAQPSSLKSENRQSMRVGWTRIRCMGLGSFRRADRGIFRNAAWAL